MEPPDIFYVVIELKVVDFMPDFIGKLYFCVSAADEVLKGDDGNPSIGILLCKDKDSSVVEWSPCGVTTPLGVACYQLQEVYERTMLEIKQQALEEKQGDNRQVKRLNGRQNLVKLSCIIERQVYQTERLIFR